MQTTDSPRAPKTGRFGPLRHRAFRRFWLGAFASNIGTWMETIAVGILITTTTGRAYWTGIVFAAGIAPGAFLGPIGGALADRYSRKAIVMASVGVQAVCSASLATLAFSGHLPPALVVGIVFASGCAAALSMPASQAVLPALVPADELARATGLTSASWHLARIAGLILAGTVVAFGGYGLAFTANVISDVAILLALAPLAIPRATAAATPMLRSIARGAAFVRAEPGLRQGFVVMTFCSLFAAPAISLVPAVALKVFDAPTHGTTVLTLAQGVGAVTFALLLGTLMQRFGGRRVLVASVSVLPAAVIAYACSPTLLVAGITVCVVGMAYITAFAGFTAVIHARTPETLRGRVLSLFIVLQAVFGPLGCIVQGRLGDSIGLRQTMLLASVAMIVAVVIASVAHRGFVSGLALEPAADAPTPPAFGTRVSVRVVDELRTHVPSRFVESHPARRSRTRTAPRTRAQ